MAMDRASGQRMAGREASAKLPALTGLRFLAASLVVAHHYLRPALTSAPKWADNIAGHGYTAVGLFFLLSGFVLAHRYLAPSGEFRGSAARFLTARLARIYPVYLLAFMLSAPFVISACLQVNTLGRGILKLSVNGLLSLGLLQSWTPWTAWYWNAPAWSLSVEAFFYLSFPLFAPVVGRMSKRMLLGAIAAIWMIAMLVPLACFFTRYGAADVPPIPFLKLLLDPGPLFRLPEFMAGVLLGRYFSLLDKQKITRGPAMVVFGFLGWVAVLAAGNSIPRLFFFAGLLTPLSSILVLGLAHGRGWLSAGLGKPALVLLGEASYGVYILQWPVAHMFGISSGTRSFVEFVLFAVTLNAVAILSLKHLESPARKFILRFFSEGLKMAPVLENASFEATLGSSHFSASQLTVMLAPGVPHTQEQTRNQTSNIAVG
jgi:peptidoglycan/LPS O-acetylase OafA/YrhL